MAKQPLSDTTKEPDYSVLQYTIEDRFYHSARSFPEVYACVREGDVENLTRHLQSEYYYEYQKATLNRMSFSHTVILLCGMLILCGREGGLPLERCVMLATRFMEGSLETDSENMVDFLCNLHLEFAQEVHHYKIENSDLVITQCRNYIYSNIQTKIDLRELAAFCGYTLNGLQHYFRRKTGETLTQCIRKEKIRKAQSLLHTTDDSCAEISEKLSFCSQSYFIEQFKRETGLTPYQFRRQVPTLYPK